MEFGKCRGRWSQRGMCVTCTYASFIASNCSCLQVCNPQCSAHTECIGCYLDLMSDTVVAVRNASECYDEHQKRLSI